MVGDRVQGKYPIGGSGPGSTISFMLARSRIPFALLPLLGGLLNGCGYRWSVPLLPDKLSSPLELELGGAASAELRVPSRLVVPALDPIDLGHLHCLTVVQDPL